MITKTLAFAAAVAAAGLFTGPGGADAAPKVKATRVAYQDPACVSACAATLAAEDQRCRDMDTQGGFNGRLYPTCAAYARYVYNNCVAQCPA